MMRIRSLLRARRSRGLLSTVLTGLPALVFFALAASVAHADDCARDWRRAED